MTRLRLAIMISGRGSNMETLIKASQAPDFPAKPVLVLSNRPDAGGLHIAESYGVQAFAVDHKSFGKDRESFERALHEELTRARIDLIALAGFMRVLTPWFVTRWQGRLINIHPSLLPKYPGLNTHQLAIEAADAEGGCSVHWVNEEVDGGAIIDQARVPILADDTPGKLAERVLDQEHVLYPRALAKACAEIAAKA